MRRFVVAEGILMLVGALTLTACKNANDNRRHPKTITEVDSLHTRVVYHNDYVKVTRITLHSGEELPLHAGNRRLIYSMNDYTLRLSENADSTTRHWTVGDVHWHDTLNYAIANVGDSAAKYLVIARTETPLPSFKSEDLYADVDHTAGDYATLLFENPYVKVVRVELAPGEEIPPHEGINRLMLAESDYALTFDSEKTGSTRISYNSGEMHWFLAGTHALKNVSDNRAQFIAISFKQ